MNMTTPINTTVTAADLSTFTAEEERPLIATDKEEEAARKAEQLDNSLDFWLKYTDVENSKVFAEAHKGAVRAYYGGTKGRTTWYVWDGMRWKEDEEGVSLELAKKTVIAQMEAAIEAWSQALREGKDEETLKKLKQRCKAARVCCSINRIHSMMDLAAADPNISVVMTQLDAQPHLINFKNGTFDTKTMQLRPHRKSDLLTQLIPISYDPNAKCPKWEGFVERVFRDKPFMPKYLQRVAPSVPTSLRQF